eukprot:Gb_11330 [translate_table: standard]
MCSFATPSELDRSKLPALFSCLAICIMIIPASMILGPNFKITSWSSFGDPLPIPVCENFGSILGYPNIKSLGIDKLCEGGHLLLVGLIRTQSLSNVAKLDGHVDFLDDDIDAGT